MNDKFLVGSLEVCDLPELGIQKLHIRVDTGAATSSLHVDNIEEYEDQGQNWVEFDIHPDIHDVKKIVRRRSKVKGTRFIKSSSGEGQKRYVIETKIVMGGKPWKIQITLSDRSSMSYLMLLGREAMNGRLIVDPEQEYVLGQ